LATTEAAIFSVAGKSSAQPTARAGALLCSLLTPLAVAVHGYHPYVEDGGLYLAGIKHLLNPHLYPYWSGFVTTHLKFSLFAPTVALAVRLSHLGLMTVLMLLYVGSTWLTLFAGWLLASRCTFSVRQCAGAVTVLALTLTIPVAGTSLMLMDPYVTARSLSTPCGILMLVGALDALAAWTERNIVAWMGIVLCGASFAVAAILHPLMAAYSLGFVLLLVSAWIPNRKARFFALTGLCAIAIAAAACLERLGTPNSLAYAEVARTRTYWFLSQWQWYELVGLAGPVAVLLLLPVGKDVRTAARHVAHSAVLAAVTSVAVSLLFSRAGSRSYEVARLQPLRVYQTVYLLMLLAVGAFLAQRVLKRSRLRWALLIAVTGTAMALAQQSTFPASGHIEWPGRSPKNAWELAFDWARIHTPETAVFALDANYIRSADEDSQNFRAVAERSMLPDEAKDGGVAAIAPTLTDQWLQGKTAQTGLDRGIGTAEAARLRALSAGWVVVPRPTPMAFPCSYENSAVKVCPLPF